MYAQIKVRPTFRCECGVTQQGEYITGEYCNTDLVELMVLIRSLENYNAPHCMPAGWSCYHSPEGYKYHCRKCDED